ncbi:cyclic nucleotide-binding domain-containing protein [Deinococcus sp. HMF7620]|uniref:Cyclic nucleotide-binding domain-containing protein n=2 Tax=Deinococcus arboris TaxID=2682977 RepID=A0A7C9HUD0_9DEIO|nr:MULTISPECIES: Crp/Fnr family transcriptional regulator [Deinococcus]MBZ9751061.1 Crp/Fnr family transcriptional regulator [Deinococcus betulae]MVN89254.1 cyclic nucleotide-binding domain-containing protein [Deinococcus arboris]
MARLDDLKASFLFHNVPQGALQEALQVITERHYRAGDTILEQDAEGEALHLLTRGVVRVSRVSLGSRERVMGDVYAPGVVGETAVLGGGERSATVVALTDVTTLMLYRSHFRQILRRHPDVLWNLSVMLVQRVTHLNDELIAFGLNTEAALSHVFTTLYRQRVQAQVPQPEVLPLSTQDIMSRISSSRETVSRVMRKLEGQKLLKSNGQTVTLLDPGGLENVTMEEADSLD